MLKERCLLPSFASPPPSSNLFSASSSSIATSSLILRIMPVLCVMLKGMAVSLEVPGQSESRTGQGRAMLQTRYLLQASIAECRKVMDEIDTIRR